MPIRALLCPLLLNKSHRAEAHAECGNMDRRPSRHCRDLGWPAYPMDEVQRLLSTYRRYLLNQSSVRCQASLAAASS